MSFTFNTNIPAANNNPSVDQPDMLINNQSTDGIIAVDHVSFNTANGGKHKQVTFNNVAAPAAQTNPQSILYTVAGTASTVSDMRFRNQNGIFPVNIIRAFGLVNGATGAVIASQSLNVASTTRNSTGNYTITLGPNVVNSENYLVIISSTTVNGVYSIVSSTQFNVTFFAGLFVDPTNFSFLVLQI